MKATFQAAAAALLLLLVAAPLASSEAGWNDPNIVLEGNPQKWVQLEEPAPGAPKPFPPLDDRWTRDDTSVVVLVASARETRCGETLFNLFSKAHNPERVYFGVVQQNAPTDEDCVEGYCKLMKAKTGGDCPHQDNIRMRRMKHTEAQGPVFARAQQNKLLKDTDEFCMQVDAHTDAVQDWDKKMLEQWGATKNEYAVISTYPTNAMELGKNANNHWEMPHICEATMSSQGMISNHQASAAANLQHPILAPLWAAGLSFSRCHAERNVGADPMLKGVFSGEEYSRGARLWTHGYDFYSPSRPYIGTWYGGDKHNRASWSTPPEAMKVSIQRLTTLLKMPRSDQSEQTLKAMEGYNLGNRRSLDAYAKYSGIDTQNQRKLPKSCRKSWVPWDRDDHYSELEAAKPEEHEEPEHEEPEQKPPSMKYEEPVDATYEERATHNAQGAGTHRKKSEIDLDKKAADVVHKIASGAEAQDKQPGGNSVPIMAFFVLAILSGVGFSMFQMLKRRQTKLI